MNVVRIAMAATLAVAWMSSSPTALAAEAHKGATAPFFFMNTYNPEASGAKRVFLDRLVGPRVKAPKKVLLLSFFNIDCKPCKKELPYLQKLHQRYRDKGLAVLVVNCDYKKQKVEEMLSYIRGAGFTFPVLKDRFRALQRRYGVESFPTMFFIDAKAIIVDVRVGYNEEKKPFPLAELQGRLGVPREAIPANDGKP